tara:strand:+ start:5361 stop:6341 length:981 start_codon:yes stop_codon:yes gene_type:complete
MSPDSDPGDIPIVDLSMDPSSVASVIRDACVRHGFFNLINHGVSESTIEGMHQSAKQFFSLPVDEKKKVCASNDPNNRGWTPPGEETLDPGTQTEGDTKEGYYVGRECEAHEIGKPLRGPNVWPDKQKIKFKFKEPMMQYHEAMTTLCNSLMPVFAAALGLEKTFFDDKFTLPSAFLRPLRYAPKKSAPSDGVLGAGAHSDYGVLTVLWTDGTPGLQIKRDDMSENTSSDTNWYPVRHVPGAFICNVGDLCERWTNGVFRSTVHRVVSDGISERHSCAFFWEPDFDTWVEPLAKCVAENPPARYEPTTYGTYILGKYNETHSGFQG